MILLKELKLNNFLSHENTTIAFGDNDKTLLDGRSGSGKSSVTEAILWVLYGKGRSDNRSLVRRGARSATVSLKLAEGSKQVAITRTVSSAGKNTLVITENRGSKGQFLPIERTGLKDAQEWIEKEFLKASYELFTNSVAYPQENENSFVKATASRRKDLLLEIVRAGNFDKLYEKAREILSGKEMKGLVAASDIGHLEETIRDNKETAAKKGFYKLLLDSTLVQTGTASSLEKDLERLLHDISSKKRELEDKKALRAATQESIDKIGVQLERHEQTRRDHATVDIETARKNVEEIETLFVKEQSINALLRESAEAQMKINAHLSNKPSVTDYTRDIESMNKSLIPLIKDTQKCPAGDECPFIRPIQGQVDFLTEQITKKTELMRSEKVAMEIWEQDYVQMVPTTNTDKLYEELNIIGNKYGALEPSKTVIAEYEMFEKTLGEIAKRETELNEERDSFILYLFEINEKVRILEEDFVKIDVNKINLDLSSIRETLRQLEKSKLEASTNLAMAEEAEKTIAKVEKAKAELSKEVATTQTEIEALTLLKEALSPRGIKAVVIDYLVPQLEERINDVLGQMSDFRIRLDTQKATVDEEGVKEGLFITVINDQREELPFASYSGGEKVKITIAISEALASLSNQTGFRIMDENIVSLDSESTMSFVTVLSRLQLKFPQLLIISHLQEVKDLFEKHLTIVKLNGVSKLMLDK